jgi:hypothetical protein
MCTTVRQEVRRVPEMPQQRFAGSELIAGSSYRVVKEFVDYDGQPHSIGETWRFIAHSFLPYDDGLTLFVERDGRNHTFRLQWREETQGEIVSSFSDYVELV